MFKIKCIYKSNKCKYIKERNQGFFRSEKIISKLLKHSQILESFPDKHRGNHKKVHREHLVGYRGVKLFLLKYVPFATVTTATVTITTVKI